jgi:hypothetical protein
VNVSVLFNIGCISPVHRLRFCPHAPTLLHPCPERTTNHSSSHYLILFTNTNMIELFTNYFFFKKIHYIYYSLKGLKQTLWIDLETL